MSVPMCADLPKLLIGETSFKKDSDIEARDALMNTFIDIDRTLL